ncbi:MAG: RAD52 family DNA repair protein [Acidobacteria bacterium]|nr:RAD52 family DNA repair protein [Acidobacteriota bacterium]
MNSNNHHALSAVSATAVQHSNGAPVTDKVSQPESDFSGLLKRLREGVSRKEIKQREGWRDRNGQTHYVEYVEWHTVADLLDRLVPDWSHRVRRIVQIGEFVAATAAITINGVTREGVGTGAADSETGIKKAEHDALKRAAVKFGVARDLYRDEEKGGETSERVNNNRPQTSGAFDPIARTQGNLITPKQLSLIRTLAKRACLEPEVLCQETFHAGLGEISRKAASALIEHLQTKLLPIPQ